MAKTRAAGELTMKPITVSSDFKIEIPEDIRDSLDLKPGHQVQLFIYNGSVHMVPVGPMSDMKGFLQGIDGRLEPRADRPL